MKRKFIILAVFIFCLALFLQPVLADEGMWPISDIHKLNLKTKGLKIEAEEIYNPQVLSLIDAIVKVGGCTGSFVSSEGLILTNHHCAYGAAQAASSKEKDYIKDGFLARNSSQEIEAKGLTARITDSYRDVSEEVLSAVRKGMDWAQRAKAIEKKIKEIVVRTEKENPGKRAEVAEMFSGKTYVLFIYTYLKDIRLVYVPPRSIGEFGGAVDNWMWPRHTGDFSFMRAYVAKDGSPAEYSSDNVPYHPRKFLEIAPQGVDEGDFVFLLGYPGRTYRHRTSHFLAYEKEVRMPYVVNWYQWQIKVMEKVSQENRAVAIKHLSRIKGLSNTMKNYQGKLKGMKRLHLVEKKREEKESLQKFIEADPNLKAKYGHVLEQMGRIYDNMRKQAERELIHDYLRRSVNMIYLGYTVYEASIELQKKDVERESAYMERNFPLTKKRLELILGNYYQPTDKIILKELLKRASDLPQDQRIPAVDNLIQGSDPDKSIDDFIEKAYNQTRLADKEFLMAALRKSTRELKAMEDPFIRLAEALYPEYQRLKKIQDERKGAMDELYAKLIDVKKMFLKKDFIPDANRTLRLTYGYVRGYSPADAIYYQPLTTLKGVIEKTTGKEPFDTPSKIIELCKAKDFVQFEHPKLKSVPVCLLYDTDTTGGNSGSPVLNAWGQLVGINFDRAFEATINDFAWSEDYSRSIAVDIRYVLWITQKFAGVDYLLREMNISL